MAFKAFKKITSLEPEVQKAAQYTKDFLNQFDLSIVYGNFLQEEGSEIVAIPTSAKKIPHRLGEKYKGYIVTEIDTSTVIRNVRSSDDDKFITLAAGSSCNARIWVF